MYIASELLGTIADTLLLVVFLNSFFFFREGRSKLIVLCFFIDWLLFSVLSLIPSLANLRVFLTFLSVAFLCFALFECSLMQSIFSSLVYCALYMLVDLVTVGLLSFIHISPHQILYDDTAHALSIVIARLISLMLFMLLKIFSKKQSDTLSFKWILPLLPSQFLSIACCMFMLDHLLQTNRGVSMLQFGFLATLFYINIVIVFYVELIRTSESRQKQHALLEQQYEIQQGYYQRLHEAQEETRALWHDIKKYVSAIQTVQGSPENAQSDALVQQVNQIVDNICPVVDVGNNVISAILDEYRSEAEQLNIDFKLDVMIPPTLGVSPIDLYVILGNTLDNAINACSVLPEKERWIHVKMRKQHMLFLYQVTNAKSDGIVRQRSGKYHGYGLKNVQRSVEHYSGQMNFSNDPHTYSVSIRLNCG